MKKFFIRTAIVIVLLIIGIPLSVAVYLYSKLHIPLPPVQPPPPVVSILGDTFNFPNEYEADYQKTRDRTGPYHVEVDYDFPITFFGGLMTNKPREIKKVLVEINEYHGFTNYVPPNLVRKQVPENITGLKYIGTNDTSDYFSTFNGTTIGCGKYNYTAWCGTTYPYDKNVIFNMTFDRDYLIYYSKIVSGLDQFMKSHEVSVR